MTRTMTPRREAWPLHLQNSTFPTDKDTIKITRLQQLHLPGWSCSFFLPELFNLPVLGISNWASIQTFFDFTSEYWHLPVIVLSLCCRSSKCLKALFTVCFNGFRIIAIQLFNATATALNCISQICCFHVALISWLAIHIGIDGEDGTRTCPNFLHDLASHFTGRIPDYEYTGWM